ncbi:uncharacterized protein LOC105650717 [Jatropha curcas]|uniref:uncharacterized protein LOC105650717 n=1 Tax=Jatropha curcas TaxID=180498 RepID=UPI0005FB8028|nr:uncharacterized protein LOC105650717 [Jatropha curcas]XP_037491648.1 uncharacterized protein LOC105650717 [Jatropha curcas]
MDESGAILCYISSLKDMLDQVNEEIEANIQITREIESEIVKCTELESTFFARESELTKTLYVSQFEINGLVSVTNEARKSVKLLEEELCSLRTKREEMLKGMNNKREQFSMLCLEFQRDIDKGENNELVKLLSEKELFENEISLMDQKNDALKNSMLAFVEEVLQDLQDSNSALHVEIQNRKHENEKLLKDIDDLKTTLHSSFNHNHS